MHTRIRSLVSLLTPLIIPLCVLLLADILGMWLTPGVYRVAVGVFGDQYIVKTSRNAPSMTFAGVTSRRFTDLRELVLNSPTGNRLPVLELATGGGSLPQPIELDLNRQHRLIPTIAAQPRRYTLLLPPENRGRHRIGVNAPASGDLMLQAVTLRLLPGSPALPPLERIAWQAVILFAALLIARRLGWPALLCRLVLLFLALTAGLLPAFSALIAADYLQRLAAAAWALVGVTWLVTAHAYTVKVQGHTRLFATLWSIGLLAACIRLSGVLYPPFSGHDLDLHEARLSAVIGGHPAIIAPSSEFASGLTLHPPGGYIILMPLQLISNDRSAFLQGSLAILDGVAAMLVGLLTVRLGGNLRAARYAALLYTGNLAALAIFDYAFLTQILGQWFMLPFALILLRASPEEAPQTDTTWQFAILVLLFGILIHVGIAVLGISMLGILVLLLIAGRGPFPWRGIGLLAVLIGLAAALVYARGSDSMLGHLLSLLADEQNSLFLPGARPQIWSGARLAFGDLGLLLLPCGLLVLRTRTQGMAGLVLIAWITTTLLYLLVDLRLGILVRYWYFAVPIVTATLGYALAQLAARGRAGKFLALGCILALTLPNLIAWYHATWGELKLPMTPLGL